VVSKVRPAVQVADIDAEICALGAFFAAAQAAEGWRQAGLHPGAVGWQKMMCRMV
jgi:hypothetical protein